jgi:uncharacterized protein (UPF0335 family)
MAKKKEETPGVGHNSEAVASGKLKSFISKIEKLNEDKVAVLDDLRLVFGEAKSAGFSVKTIRQIVRERAMDVEKRREEQALLEIYRSAVGLLSDD